MAKEDELFNRPTGSDNAGLDFRAYGSPGRGRDRFDTEMQMFVEQPKEPDIARLRFLRWLGENGRLEHETAGEPSGDLAAGVFDIPIAAGQGK